MVRSVKILPHQKVWLEAYLNNKRIFEIANDPQLNPLGRNKETIREFIRGTKYYKPIYPPRAKKYARLCPVCGLGYSKGTYESHKNSNIHIINLFETKRDKLNRPFAKYLALKGFSASLIAKLCEVRLHTVVKFLNGLDINNDHSEIMKYIESLPFDTKTVELQKILDGIRIEYQRQQKFGNKVMVKMEVSK